MGRILDLFLSVFVIITTLFFLLRILPGDPSLFILGEHADTKARIAFLHQHGLDAPSGKAYLGFLSKLAQGDLGNSYRTSTPVTYLLSQHAPMTVGLACLSVFFSWTFALMAMCVVAVPWLRNMSSIQHLLLLFPSLSTALPMVVSGPLLIWGLSYSVSLFPLPRIHQVHPIAASVLPALSLSIPLSGILFRQAMASMLAFEKTPVFMQNIAKGHSTWHVHLTHGFRQRVRVLLSLSLLQWGALLAGTAVTERIFGLEGMGHLMIGAVLSRDFPVLLGCALWATLLWSLVQGMGHFFLQRLEGQP